MDVSNFSFSIEGTLEKPVQIVASNGPIVVVFSIMAHGLIYQPIGSNVDLRWEHMPAVALATARAWRRYSREAVEAAAKHLDRVITDAGRAANSVDAARRSERDERIHANDAEPGADDPRWSS